MSSEYGNCQTQQLCLRPSSQATTSRVIHTNINCKWDSVSISDNTTFDEESKCLIGKSLCLDHMQRNPKGRFSHIVSLVTVIWFIKTPFMDKLSFLLNRTPKVCARIQGSKFLISYVLMLLKIKRININHVLRVWFLPVVLLIWTEIIWYLELHHSGINLTTMQLV